MRVYGRIFLGDDLPLEGLLVQIFDVGDGRVTRREVLDGRRLAETFSNRDGTFELSIEGTSPETHVALVVRDKDRKRPVHITRPVVAAKVPETVKINLSISADDSDDEGAATETETPHRETGESEPEVSKKPTSRILGAIIGRGRRPRTVELRIKTEKGMRPIASTFVTKKGEFLIDVSHLSGKVTEDNPAVLVVLAAASGEEEVELYRKEGIVPLDVGDLALTIELGGGRPERPRPPRPENPEDAGELAERFASSRVGLEAFRDRLITDPYLKIRPSEAATVDVAKDRRKKVISGTVDERFVPSKRPFDERSKNPRFVDSTVGRDSRAEGRYIAQLDAAAEGLTRLEGARRGGLRFQLDPEVLKKLPGVEFDGENFHIPADVFFDYLGDRVPVAPVRRPPPQTMIDRLQDCIDEAEAEGPDHE